MCRRVWECSSVCRESSSRSELQGWERRPEVALCGLCFFPSTLTCDGDALAVPTINLLLSLQFLSPFSNLFGDRKQYGNEDNDDDDDAPATTQLFPLI